MAENNRKAIIKAFIIVVFIIVLAFPGLMLHYSSNSSGEKNLMDKEAILNQYGFYLEEISEKAGVQFMHRSPELDPLCDPILPQIASMGASVAVSDFDRDGWNDFYVTNSRFGYKNCLYHNQRDGTFVDVADKMGIADLNRKGVGVSMGAVWADYDNDGFEDLLIYRWGRPELFKNNNGKGFDRVTDNSGLPDWINANTAIWLDYNSDGFADLFIGGYFPETINLWNLKSTRILTESFEYAQNGGRNFLFENNGNGTFTDVTFARGLTSTRWTLAAGSADINGDGFPELIVANDFGIDEFYINREGKHFVDEGNSTMIGFSPKSGMNVSFGDVFNNGQFGIYISNITEEGVLIQGNNFWIPVIRDGRIMYENAARRAGIEFGGWSYSAQFGDLNNDGFTDLYLANGYISGEKGTDYWYDYSKVTGGNASIISDIKNWPAMEGRSHSGYQQNKIWINQQANYFTEVSNQVISGRETYDSRSVAIADLWNTGHLDIIVANQNNRLLIYKNYVKPDNHWIAFELKGQKNNRSAINTMVELHWDNKVQTQIVTGGIGFCSQNQRRLHFGLGNIAIIDSAVIIWPGNKRQVVRDSEVNNLVQITEEDD
jgi:hypothetical protein